MAGAPATAGAHAAGARRRPEGLALRIAAAMAWSVVIAGGGFGGLYAARRLERRLPRHSARIVLVSDVNFLLYSPLLPGAAAGSLEPRHVVVPLREELEWTDVRLGRVTGADPALRELRLRTADGRDEALRYEQLVVALGSVSRVLPVPGLAEHAMGFKTLAEAIELRNHTLWSLEVAEQLEDPGARRGYLTFVFVGAGYAGLEAIAELQDYVADVIDRYPRCRLDGTRWILVEAEDRVMPEIPASLADFATRELRGRGIEIRTGTRLDSMDAGSATLSTGETIPTRTVCWTTGVKPPAVVRELGLPLDRSGRIETDATMRVKGREGVWAIGDAAAVPDPAKRGREPSPPTAQHAIRQGRLVAENVAAALAGRPPREFRYRTLGVFVDMGQHKAVATVLGVRLRGFPAWFAARTYHLAMMPGTVRRLRLMFDWTVGLLFGRAAAELGQLGRAPPLGSYIDSEREEERAP
jgi:NADH dehydrogenase